MVGHPLRGALPWSTIKGVNVQEEHQGRLITIAGIINLFPEKHSQATWICGTTHCVGGYAVNLFSKEEVAWDDLNGGALYAPVDSNVAALYGNRMGSYAYVKVDPKENDGSSFRHKNLDDFAEGDVKWRPINIHAFAAELLGITHDEAVVLFNAESTLAQVNNIIKNMIEGHHVGVYEHGTNCECEYCYEIEEYEEEYYGDEDY